LKGKISNRFIKDLKRLAGKGNISTLNLLIAGLFALPMYGAEMKNLEDEQK
jgi:hypothetical protein